VTKSPPSPRDGPSGPRAEPTPPSMPRHPHISSTVQEMPGSIFSELAHRLTTYSGEVYPLHVGDTWMEPAPGCRMEDLTVREFPGMHRYALPQGMPQLIEAVAQRFELRTGVSTRPANVLVAAGATGALAAVTGALLDPGDEVLILAPHWPLISGIVRTAHGRPVPVPFLGCVDSPESAVEAVSDYLSDRTVALYLSTPNNPTGSVLDASWIEALIEWSRQNDLWLFADEVYEDYVYADTPHVYTRALAPERTFSVHSFSKAYGMAGNRCGYVVGPQEKISALRKVSIHSFYSTPTASQLAALRVLGPAGDRWIEQAREKYRELGTWAAGRLGLDPPQGSTFLFPDVSEHLDERGLVGFLGDCADRGLFLAPGPSFGPYPRHLRVCFTSAQPEIVRRGIDVLAELMGQEVAR